MSGESPSVGDTVRLRVRVPHGPDGSPGAAGVLLRWVHDGEPDYLEGAEESRDAAGAWWVADLSVGNPVTSYRFLVLGGGGRGSGDSYRWLNGTGLHTRDVTDAADFRISTRHRLPDWVPDQVGYQIFPDRFAPTQNGAGSSEWPEWAERGEWSDPVSHRGRSAATQLYGGTLDGIREHLDHVASLGANLVYLTPFFEARSNHRYDAVSFDRVDPVLGGDRALDQLLAVAHDRGIRVVGDLTTNHTGNGHAWFRRAVDDPSSVERSFYRFTDGTYAAWLGHPSLPKLDHASPELARRLYDGADSVVGRWLARGLDAWRIDVANMTGRLDEADLAHDVARGVRRAMAVVRPDAWLLAEHCHDATHDLQGDGWHGTMDYAGFTRPLWAWLNGGSATGPGIRHGLGFLGMPTDVPVLDGPSVVATMREVHAAMPWVSVLGSTMHLDTHDTARFRTVAGGGVDGGIDTAGVGRDRHLVGVALQLTMPGVPVLFAGDEIGLTGVDGEHARTPFPWHLASDWDVATLAAYRSWAQCRHEHVALRRGGLRWLHVGADSMTYLREHPEETVLIHAARAAHPDVHLPLTALGPGVRALNQLVTTGASTGSGSAGSGPGRSRGDGSGRSGGAGSVGATAQVREGHLTLSAADPGAAAYQVIPRKSDS